MNPAESGEAPRQPSTFVNRTIPHELTPVTDALLADPPPGDWLTWRRTRDGHGYSPLDQITRDNVGDLQLAWSISVRPGERYTEQTCFITGHDPDTGDELWLTSTIALPGDPNNASWGDTPPYLRAGGDSWIPGSYDPDLGLFFIGTAQAKPWVASSRGMTTWQDALYTNSTLVLNPQTGQVEWYFQHAPGETLNLDIVYERVLVDADGERWLFTIGKDGILWKLDRRTGAFVDLRKTVHQDIFASVDRDTGELTYRDDLQDIAIGECVFACPSLLGGHNWQASAYHPGAGALVIPLSPDHNLLHLSKIQASVFHVPVVLVPHVGEALEEEQREDVLLVAAGVDQSSAEAGFRQRRLEGCPRLGQRWHVLADRPDAVRATAAGGRRGGRRPASDGSVDPETGRHPVRQVRQDQRGGRTNVERQEAVQLHVARALVQPDQDAAKCNHGEGDGPVQPALGPVGCALVQVVSDAIEPKHFHGNAAADPAEDESHHYGLANIWISAKVSRRVFGRNFSV